MRVYPVKSQSKQDAIEIYLNNRYIRNLLAWIVGTHTGLRVSDIVKLKVSHFSSDILTIVEQKTKKTKSIRISNKLKKMAREYIIKNKLNKDDYLFTSRQSNKNHMSIRRIQQIIKSLGNILDIKDNINSHTMRKTFAYNLYIKSNYNIALVMQSLNHSNQYVTLKYLCIENDEINNLIIDF